MARQVRRELRMARADGILRGLLAGLRPGDVCLDFGAHIGDVTVPLAQTGALVHAYEPDPDNFAKLQEATSGYDNVVLHKAAVGRVEGTARLFRSTLNENKPAVGATGSTLLEGSAVADAEDAVDVQLRDVVAVIEDVLALHERIAFIKMDIEGTELAVLERLLETDLLEKVNLTAVETHRWLLPKEEASRFDALHKIASDRPELGLFLSWI